MQKRTMYCGDVRLSNVGEEVTLTGWVQNRRDLGGLIFIDMRDREGLVQVVFNPETSRSAWEVADKLRKEYVLAVTGKVIAREGAVNEKLKTGEIEVLVSEIEILNKAKTTPFEITDHQTSNEDIRMSYRYLDLRRPHMQANLRLRHQVTKTVRNFLDNADFIDIETPYLAKSTPEGARDYLVPSRVHPGEFYALPQSPQIIKQLLMSSGFDRYYQIVKCFRDEDLRGDRQPEFTQIDIETSFLSSEDIQKMTEQMIAQVMRETKGVELELPLPRISYDEAMARYGSDKPDTRFGMELIDLSETVADVDFMVFKNALKANGVVKALNVKGANDKYSRKDLDGLAEYVKVFKAKGLAWVKVEEDGLKGPIAKFLVDHSESIIKATEAEAGDLLLFAADQSDIVAATLGNLRTRLAKELDLIDDSQFNYLWVVDWPLLEYNEEAGRYTSAHHPFTLPKASDIPNLETNPEKVYAEAYDIVLNGYELGGGSLRVYQRELQEQIFKALGFSEEAARSQFGFLLDALDYGFPPHGGIALGLDRWIMLLAGEDNIREVMAFPKNSRAVDMMTEAPSHVSDLQLSELGLIIEE